MQEQLGGPAACSINELPGSWLDSPTVACLQFNDFPSRDAPTIGIAGRMATFEIYANIGQPQGKTAIVLLFSKKLGGVWPHFSSVGARAQRAMEES